MDNSEKDEYIKKLEIEIKALKYKLSAGTTTTQDLPN